MSKTDRKIIELVNAIRGSQGNQTLLVAKVNSIDPFTLKMNDLIVNQHIYVNSSFLKTTSSQINANVVWDENQDYVPNTFLSFSKQMLKADLLSVGDRVIVLLDGIEFYVLERVVKAA